MDHNPNIPGTMTFADTHCFARYSIISLELFWDNYNYFFYLKYICDKNIGYFSESKTIINRSLINGAYRPPVPLEWYFRPWRLYHIQAEWIAAYLTRYKRKRPSRAGTLSFQFDIWRPAKTTISQMIFIWIFLNTIHYLFIQISTKTVPWSKHFRLYNTFSIKEIT